MFGKSMKSNCEEELCFSLGFLSFKYSHATHTFSQMEEKEDEWRRKIISEEIGRKKFGSQTWNLEVVSKKVSQEKKMSINTKIKGEVGNGDITIPRQG